MSPISKTLLTIGLSLTVLGCFLPWWQEGDFVSYWKTGLRLFPSIENNGGVLILLLCLILIVLTFYPLSFIERPKNWLLTFSVILTIDAIFQVVKIAIARLNMTGVFGAPLIQFGLPVVLVGSLFILVISILCYREIL